MEDKYSKKILTELEQILPMTGSELIEHGRQIGFAEGFKEGFAEGFQEGFQEGKAAALAEIKANAKAEGRRIGA